MNEKKTFFLEWLGTFMVLLGVLLIILIVIFISRDNIWVILNYITANPHERAAIPKWQLLDSVVQVLIFTPIILAPIIYVAVKVIKRIHNSELETISDNIADDSKIYELNLASRKLRFDGFLIDIVFLSIFSGILFLMQLGVLGKSLFEYSPLVISLVALTLPLAFMVLNGFLIYKRGQTVGKWVCNTVVVTLDGKQVSGNRYLFLRVLPIWLTIQIPYVGQIFMLINCLLIFRKEKNCLHDDIAKTRVVMKT